MGLESSFFPRPGLAPAGDLLSFASPKERKQRKGDPAVCVPPLRCGQPAVLAFRGVRRTRFAQTAAALIRETLRSSAHTEGLWGPHTPSLRSAAPSGLRFARLGLAPSPSGGRLGWGHATLDETRLCSKGRRAPIPAFPRKGKEQCTKPGVPCLVFLPPLPGEGRGGGTAAERSNGPTASRAKQWPGLSPPPSGCAEERSGSRTRARRCLSEASSARPREPRAPQVARSEAEGRRQWGRLSFAYLSLAKQRKVGRLPGRDPASEKKQTQGQQEC
ncbi:hypothetical protein Varpa_0442 [Variovorax paradoxus EPS]|uniref:Uncharacterized protein n=1 Tax=Variovorax paradoxus (strain EPS) TaxID=595537 RepID=E6V4B8_VARPE|nr:hypothetical protein Varpa_0442 [Variovorax paradoxus EPS]